MDAIDEKLRGYFERLEALSSDELDQSAEKLVLGEKRNVALLIAHLVEMSRRNRKFKEKLERLAEVLGIENVEKHLEEILERPWT